MRSKDNRIHRAATDRVSTSGANTTLKHNPKASAPTHAQPTPAQLYDMASSYFMIARVLQVAAQLDLFTHLAGDARTATELASELGVDAQGLERLLTACAALRLLERRQDYFQLSAFAAERLDRNRPGFMGEMLAGLSEVYHDWGRLEEAIQSGHSVASTTRDKDAHSHRHLVLATHASHQALAATVAEHVLEFWSSRPQARTLQIKTVLDVGSGAGTFALALCQRAPQIRATLVDLPQVTAIADEIVASVGFSDRVRILPLDYQSGTLPINQDVVLLCNVLHLESGPTATALLKKVYSSLRQGGIVVIVDAMLNANKDGPLTVALGALNQYIRHPQSRYYAPQEVENLLNDAGLHMQSRRALPFQEMWLLIATKL